MQKLSPQGKNILKRRIKYYEEVTKDGTTDQIQHSCKVGIIDKCKTSTMRTSVITARG